MAISTATSTATSKVTGLHQPGPHQPGPHQQRGTKIVLILFSILYLSLLAPWLPLAVWSMAFLADSSVDGLAGLIFSRILPVSVLVYPVLVLLGLFFGWYFLRRRRTGKALLFGVGLPSLSVTPWLVALVVLLARAS